MPGLTRLDPASMVVSRATTLEQCADLVRASFARPGPFLVDLRVG
jgi:hypothetical protein